MSRRVVLAQYWYRLTVVFGDGARTTFQPIAVQTLAANPHVEVSLTPNPVMGSIRIEYVTSREERARLSVIDLQGREVHVLVDGLIPTGSHALIWDGVGLPPGIYFARWRSSSAETVRRFTRLR